MFDVIVMLDAYRFISVYICACGFYCIIAESNLSVIKWANTVELFFRKICAGLQFYFRPLKTRLRTEAVKISLFAVGCFPCYGTELRVLRILHDGSTARSHWFCSAFHERGLILIRSEMPWDRVPVAGNIFFFCFGFNSSPQGIFSCNAIFVYPAFYAALLRLASAILIVPRKIKSVRRAGDDEFIFNNNKDHRIHV